MRTVLAEIPASSAVADIFVEHPMTDAAALTPPSEGTREDLIQYYRSLLATPHSDPDCVELRRQGREGLTLIGASPASKGFMRRQFCLVSSYFRASRPKGRAKRL